MAEEAFGRIVRGFWTDPEINRLSKDLKLLLLYFFTSPHSNMIGLYFCPLLYVAAETDVAAEAIRKAVAGPLAPYLSYDDGTREVFVHALAKHNMGKTLVALGKNDKPDHRIVKVENLVEAVHSLPLKRAFLDRYAADYNLVVRLPDDPPSVVPILTEKPRRGLTDAEQAVIDYYRTVHPKRLKGDVPSAILRLLRVALKSYNVVQLRRAIDGNAGSEFHRENGHQGLDLILRDASKIDYYMDLADKQDNEVQMITDDFGRDVPHKKNEFGEWVPVGKGAA